MNNHISRRTFTQVSAAAAMGMTAFQADKVLGANERIRIGFIGVGGRGKDVMGAFLKHGDVEIVALCDVCKSALEGANAMLNGRADTYSDFRKLIERNDIDAIAIASPDHWHAIQMIDACDAGKDVYVEKPLSITIHEGRKMVEAARKNKRVVQVGIHRRSSPLYKKAVEFVRAGKLGKITVGRCFRLSNMYPNGIGKRQPTKPPTGLDWDMWLGPRPERPYQANIAPYKFRWWKLYSSQAANWGVHFLDAMRWMTGEEAPSSVCTMGGNYAVDDDRTIPDTLQATFEFASGWLAVFGQYEASGNKVFPQSGEIELRGTQGTCYVDQNGYTVVPERGGQFQDPKPRMKRLSVGGGIGNLEMTALHARNFLDCMKSRKNPHADIEIGHRSTTFSHLINISLATGQRLDWDAKAERFTNSEAANNMLHYEYRKPWKLG